MPGRIDFSPISPALCRLERTFLAKEFFVGRLSRDVPGKHHPHDVGLYHELITAGINVRLMGASTLYRARAQQPPAGLELVPEGAEPAEDFLFTLQCFVYRTHPAWTEPHGRVVTEAMASGLPVVCDNRGGFTEFIEDGFNGFLFSDTREAVDIVQHLQHHPEVCKQVGLRGRETVVELLEKRSDFAAYCCAVPS